MKKSIFQKEQKPESTIKSGTDISSKSASVSEPIIESFDNIDVLDSKDHQSNSYQAVDTNFWSSIGLGTKGDRFKVK